MTMHPPITVTSLDLARIESLLDSLPPGNRAAAEALRAELDRAEIVAPQDVPPGVVTMNSTVHFVMEPAGKAFELSLRYPRDLDGGPGQVSILAPVGSALLGLSVGQRIDWSVPNGRDIALRVANISYQPERAGDFLR